MAQGAHLRRVIMPIYEYRCRDCEHEFEQLVLHNGTPHCPTCQSEKLERLLSSFGVSTAGTRRTNLNSAKRQASKVQRDKQHAEYEHMRNHQH